MNLLHALLKQAAVFVCTASFFCGLQAATISAGPNGVGVAIEGEIKLGDYQKYGKFRVANLANSKVFATVVFLNSPGGNVKESLKFAEAFSSNLISTFVLDGKSCFSACTMIWAGGVDRNLVGTGRLGFHRLSFNEKEVDVQKTRAVLTPANLKVAAFFRDVGFPASIIDKMNETAPTDLFIVNQRWLSEHELDLAIRYQPTFLDVVEKRCGVEPTTAVFRNNQSFSQEVKAQFIKWLDCAEEVKDANRILQIKEGMKNDADEERTLRQMGETIARTKWTLLFNVDDMVAHINKSSQRWSAATTQVQSLAEFKSNNSTSLMDYKVVDCDLGTINSIEGATSLTCDGSMCKTPTFISKNKPSAPKKPPPGSFNALFVEAICKTR